MVYFIQSINGGPIKIGRSNNINSRVKSLEKYYGEPMAILATMPGHHNEEQAIHRQFAHLRMGNSEQFHPGPDLMEFISRPLLARAGKDAEMMRPEQPIKMARIAIRSTPEWLDFVDKLARLRGISNRADLLAVLVQEDAQRHGRPLPPRMG